MAIFTQKDGPRIYRYFTGKNVGFLKPGDIIRLRLHEELDRVWAIHKRGGWTSLHTPEKAGEIQLLDLLFERDELEEFTAENESLLEKEAGLEMPDLRA